MAAAAVLIAVLAIGLPPEGFFSGDQGIKLIAARSAVAHPQRAFEVDAPRVGGKPIFHVNRFFRVHDDHLDPLQSPLFPVLSAPFVAVFGLRGIYILPALSFVVLIPVMEALRRRALPEVPPALMAALTLLANPLFFYAFEFWEHVPAAALCAGATVLAWPGSPREVTRQFLAGALVALATALRPEALWFLAGLVVAMRALPPAATVSGGAALVFAGFALANYLHSGNPLGAYLSANLAPPPDHWLYTRFARGGLWLMPRHPLAVIGLALIGTALATRVWRWRDDVAQIVALAGCTLVAGAAAAGVLDRQLLWHAWPLGLLLFVPRNIASDEWRLILIGATTACGILAAAAHSHGGAQWGPRLLLIASPVWLALATSSIYRLTRGHGPTRAVKVALVGLTIAASVMMSRQAYLEIRTAKNAYAGLVADTRAAVPEGAVIVSDIWWFDQITAPLYGRNTFLVASDENAARALLFELQEAGVKDFVVADGEESPGHARAALAGACYEMREVGKSATRRVTFTVVSETACR
jgi:hypothetical protein